uniref:Uncharacterized protein n=1 Tax=Oryza brachyantha TaxID=4533 RepID=J3LNP2_ORYBR
MICVSWSDRDSAASRQEKVVRKLFELDLGTRPVGRGVVAPGRGQWGGDTIYSVEMFRIFGKVLDFVTACRVSDTDDRRWCRLARKNAAADADAMSSRLKSMAALHL